MTTAGGKQLASRPQSSGRRIPAAAWILLLIAGVIAGVAGVLIHQGLQEVHRAAPLPSANFSVQPGHVAGGSGTTGAAGSTTRGGSAEAAGTSRLPAGGAAGTGVAATAAGGSAPRSQQPSAPIADDHVVIPALGVDAPLTPEVVSNGALTIPGDVGTVGAWTGSAALTSTTGTVLLAGHIDNINQGPGALHDLYLLQPGDKVFVRLHGVSTKWQIVTLGSYPKSEIPQDLFDGSQGPRRLVLVTCGGQIHNGEYDQNVVATAVPA